MRTFLQKLNSRKLIMALLAGGIAFSRAYFPDIPAEDVELVVKCLLGYVAVEGAVDAFGVVGKWLAEITLNK